MVVGISITGRVARLVRYNYGVPRIALAGGKAKAASTPGGKKERKEEISGAGNEPYSSPRGGGRFNSFNFTDEIILTAYPDFAVRFASYLEASNSKPAQHRSL